MNAIDSETPTYCARHPKVETVLMCGKCGTPICPRCIIQTPVGARCITCANLKRLPQFQIEPWLLFTSFAAGFCTSLVSWWLLSYIAYLRFFLSILVGVAVGEVMTRVGRRRTGLPMEAAAVIAVVAGLVVVESAYYGGLSSLLTELRHNQFALSAVILPGILASVVAVLKLR
jgi:hypothetical protein